MELDYKDRELLLELDLDCRQSFSELARKLQLSRDAVKYRILKLQDSGIIKSFGAVIDVGKLGFLSFRLFLKFYQLSPEKEKEIVSYLLLEKNLLWMVRIQGDWDLNILFSCRKVDEMNDFWMCLYEKFGNFIADKEIGIFTKNTYFNRVFLSEKKRKTTQLPFVTLPNEKKIDKKDLRIIELLSANARMPIIELAQKTNLTPKTVISKIKRIEKEGIIQGYKAELNLEKLGFQYYKIYISTFNTTPEKIKRLKDFIFEHPNIVYDDVVLGGYDVEFEIQAQSEKKIREILEEIREKFSSIIKDYKVQHYFKEYRLRFFPAE